MTICVLVFVQTFVLEPFHIPSGSMAPALFGHHRVCACPRCGQENAVGRASADAQGKGEPRFYRKAFCSNCGLFPLPLDDVRETAGDKIVVNKAAFLTRTPSRFEIVVFRLLGTFYIKRLLGLPGEEILLHDGDVYVNGELLRKGFAEARAMRMLLFDQKNAPAEGWKERWEFSNFVGTPGARSTSPLGLPIFLDGLTSPCTLTYRHFSLESRKCEPLRDEYAYNAGLHADSECVHDFWIDTEIEASGHGSLALRLCDGHDWIEVLLPVGESRAVEAFAWPMTAPHETRKLAETGNLAGLRANQRYRVEMGFVDRRLHLAIDGQVWLTVDLPEAKDRQGVERPFQVSADGVKAGLRRVQIYRDLHYGQQGKNAVRGKAVRLGVNQYFMLGDNSPNSEDSRFWVGDGSIDGASFVGSVFLVNGSHGERR
jgi:signal peptidase I